jgi:hypothetical protein
MTLTAHCPGGPAACHHLAMTIPALAGVLSVRSWEWRCAG